MDGLLRGIHINPELASFGTDLNALAVVANFDQVRVRHLSQLLGELPECGQQEAGLFRGALNFPIRNEAGGEGDCGGRNDQVVVFPVELMFVHGDAYHAFPERIGTCENGRASKPASNLS